MAEEDQDVIVPVAREELHVDAIPVATGGIRVTKRINTHDEIVEQELQKSRVQVKRVKMERVVDGPQPVRRTGDTLIIPVVSEVLRIEKQWVLTEEIHLTQLKEQETVQSKITLNREEAHVERIDRSGNVIARVDETTESRDESRRPASMLQQSNTSASSAKRTALRRSRSILKTRSD